VKRNVNLGKLQAGYLFPEVRAAVEKPCSKPYASWPAELEHNTEARRASTDARVREEGEPRCGHSGAALPHARRPTGFSPPSPEVAKSWQMLTERGGWVWVCVCDRSRAGATSTWRRTRTRRSSAWASEIPRSPSPKPSGRAWRTPRRRWARPRATAGACNRLERFLRPPPLPALVVRADEGVVTR
jgi:hypothetical protein